ncbi:MAG: ParA family protein [Pyrobaculum sp.]
MSNDAGGRIISFISAGGGVGKTTLAIYLAYMLAHNGKRTLLIDLDPSAGLSVQLLGDIEVARLEDGKKTVGDILQSLIKGEHVDLRNFIISIYIDGREVELIPGGDEIADVMVKIWGGSYLEPAKRIRKFVENFRKGWDFIVLDTVPFYEPRYTLASLAAADKVIIVTQPYGAEPYRLRRMYEKLVRGVEGDRDKVRSKTRLLINKVEKTTNEGRKPELLNEKFNVDIPRFDVVIPKSVALTRITAEGKRVTTGYKALSDVLEEFYKEVVEWVGEPVVEPVVEYDVH